MRTKIKMERMSIKQKVGFTVIRQLGLAQQWIFDHLVGEFVWCSSDGKCTPISCLDSSHIVNIIRMLKRSGEQPKYLDIVKAEAVRRKLRY